MVALADKPVRKMACDHQPVADRAEIARARRGQWRSGPAPARDPAWRQAAGGCPREGRNRSRNAPHRPAGWRWHKGRTAGLTAATAMQREPAAVTARSITESRLPRRSPCSVRVSSRLARVAGSISRIEEGSSRRGGRRCGTRPAWVMTMYSRSPPSAEISVREKLPKPSSAATSKLLLEAAFARQASRSERREAASPARRPGRRGSRPPGPPEAHPPR